MRAALSLALASALTFLAAAVRAEVVNRVVAVVDREVITLSELEQRARVQVAPLQRGKLAPEVLRAVLEHLIDERLEARVATSRRIAVTSAEIERGIENIAASRGATLEATLSEVKRLGLSEAEYREEYPAPDPRGQAGAGPRTTARVRAARDARASGRGETKALHGGARGGEEEMD